MPALADVRVRRALAGVVCVAAACGGAAACGPLPPEAPVWAASTISSALTTLASSCGESYRLREFHPHASLASLERTASSSAVTLGRLSHRHPEWVYQSKNLAQLDAMSANLLQACSLRGAAAVLLRSSR